MSPGTEIGITRDLQSGNYAFICFIRAPNGKPHYQLGMLKGFEVSGDSGNDVPDTDGSITATDTKFEVSALSAGDQTIELKNAASKPREFNLFELKPGKAVSDLRAWYANGQKGEPPATLLGALQSIPSGETDYLDLNVVAGRTYLVIDPENGQKATFKAG
jgi:hypothetical protein